MFRTVAVVLCTFLAGPVSAATLYEPFTSLYVFGDSTADDGKLGAALPPPSFEGRFSNGPVTPEFIADLFEQNGLPNFNLALGGATAGDENENDAALPPPLRDSFGTLARQVDTLETSGTTALSGNKPLVSIQIGANDFFQRASDPGFNPASVALDIVGNIQNIAAIPNFNDFLVFNLPDLSRLPANAGLPALDRALLSGGVQLYNGALDIALRQTALTDPDFNFSIFDTFTTFDNLLAQAPSLGLNTTAVCTPSIANADDFNVCPTAASANAFFFVDGVHASSLVQQLVAAEAIAETKGLPSPVPVPAGLPFLLIGIGAFGLLKARQRKILA